jgi:four helix bundle protein
LGVGVDPSPAIKSFRDLRVWQAGMTLVEHVYRLTESFPRSETYGLASQMQRAVVSIPSNVAEGHARESSKEYLRHLSVAQGSLAELQTQLEIAVRLRYCSSADVSPLLESGAALSRQLHALRNALLTRMAALPQPPTPNSQPPC